MVVIYSMIHCKHYSRHRTGIFYCENSQLIPKKYQLTSLHDQAEPSTSSERFPGFIFLVNFDASQYVQG